MLYDVLMLCRHERSIAQQRNLWKLAWRMCAEFLAEDKAERDGRKSWRPAHEIIKRYRHLMATFYRI